MGEVSSKVKSVSIHGKRYYSLEGIIEAIENVKEEGRRSGHPEEAFVLVDSLLNGFRRGPATDD